MAKPPYLAIMMLNPAESAIQDIQEAQTTTEESIIAGMSSSSSFSKPEILVPKQRLALVLWLTITFIILHSWFSFALAIPKLQYYYSKDYLTVSTLVWIFPLILAILMPILCKFLQKFTSSLVCLMISAFLSAFGCAVKCTGTNLNGFFITAVGQLFIMMAFPFSLGFPVLFLKQHPSRKWWISSTGIAAIASGSISGITLLPILLAGKEKTNEIGVIIYKYFVWSAVLAIIPLVLIPFAMKEQKQFYAKDYKAINTISAPPNEDGPRCEQSSTVSSSTYIRSIVKSQLCAVRDKKFLIKASMSGVNYGLFLNIFIASVICVHFEAKRIWTLCIVESAVILTCCILFVSLALKELNIPRWIIVANNLMLMAATIAFVVCAETKPLSLRLFLFYFLHASSGLSCLISIKKSLPRTDSANFLPMVTILQGLFATMTCFLLSGLLWRFSVVAWTVSICLLASLPILCSFLPL